MNVIEIDHLTYSYPGAEQPTLKGITVKIKKGDFLAIVGNNGCGKSTFCKTLNGLIPQFISGDFQGSVRACDLDTRETDVGTLARKVGYVYQDFENQIIRPTVLDDASYACLNYAMPDYRERGLQALEQCGLKGKQDDFIWQLSGGQTHLLALAGAVSLQPEVLILDEPIAQLDPKHADQCGSTGTERELRQDHHRHRASHRIYCRLLQTCDADEGRYGAMGTAYRRSPPAGGGTARLQYLSSAGDHCSPSDATSRRAPRNHCASDHSGRRKSNLCSKRPSR